MYTALIVGRERNLAAFSNFLNEQGIFHRITEEGDQQVLWVGRENHVGLVQGLFEQVDAGAIDPAGLSSPGAVGFDGRDLFRRMARVPLTALLILASVLCFPATTGIDHGEVTWLLHALTFVPFEVRGALVYFGTLGDVHEQGEYWRMLSPMLIHFGVLHIVFNLLWIWEIGRRIEAMQGTVVLLTLVLASSLAANFTQYWLSGPGLFGGMSGVVFGLLGFALIWSKLIPARTLGLPDGIYLFMLGFLAAGFSGLLDFLIPGSLANGAHLGGLIGGILCGLAVVALSRFRPS